MKRFLLAAGAVLVSISASAATGIDTAAIKAYATHAMARCSGSSVDVQRVEGNGPQGFAVFRAKLNSTDESCARQTYLLYSPTSQQVLIGTIIPLPEEGRSTEARVSAKASELLRTPINASVGKFPLPDGVKSVSMMKQTEWGPFNYHGYLDASERFLIVGTRGNLRVDPAKTLLESVGAVNGVQRGSKTAKVEIVELSDFQCPTCGRAHKKIEPIIAKNLKKIHYTRLDLPLFEHHEWAVPAALGARAIQRVAPSKYWNYVNFMFQMQDNITRPTFDKILQDFCSDNDIDWKAVEKIYKSPAERTAILEQVSRAFDASIISTPTYIINGQQVGYGPEGSFTIEMINKAIAGAGK
jgi:protein-disulfide isomerase